MARLYVPRIFLNKIVNAIVDDYKGLSQQTSPRHLPLLIEGITGALEEIIEDELPEAELDEVDIWGDMFHSPPKRTISKGTCILTVLIHSQSFDCNSIGEACGRDA